MAILTGRKTLHVILIALFSFFYFPGVQADEKSLQLYEQKIKAGIVYNLLKYTNLPEKTLPLINGKLQICLYGEDLFEGYLSPLEGRTVQQITIAINSIKTPAEVESCSVVIIHHTQLHKLPQLLDTINKNHILSISDAKSFAQLGGMIELSKENEKISLYINTTAVAEADLSIQDPMLKLATIVTPLRQEK